MQGRGCGRGRWIFFPIGIVVFVGLAGLVVMSLWNALLPELFGFKLVTFWQAVGLVVLSHILFKGGFRRHGREWHGRVGCRIHEALHGEGEVEEQGGEKK